MLRLRSKSTQRPLGLFPLGLFPLGLLKALCSRTWISSGLLSFATLLLVNTPLRTQLLTGYADDTIHHLSPLGSTGLILITLSLSIAFLVACDLKTQWLLKQRLPLVRLLPFSGAPMMTRVTHQVITLVIDLATTLVLFWLSLSLVPALHYLYYQLLFDNLPNQWVVHRLIPFDAFVKHLYPLPGGTLAQHSSAVLLFAALINSFYHAIRQMGSVKPDRHASNGL